MVAFVPGVMVIFKCKKGGWEGWQQLHLFHLFIQLSIIRNVKPISELPLPIEIYLHIMVSGPMDSVPTKEARKLSIGFHSCLDGGCEGGSGVGRELG